MSYIIMSNITKAFAISEKSLRVLIKSVKTYYVNIFQPVVSTYHSVEAVNPDFIFYSVKSKEIKVIFALKY